MKDKFESKTMLYIKHLVRYRNWSFLHVIFVTLILIMLIDIDYPFMVIRRLLSSPKYIHKIKKSTKVCNEVMPKPAPKCKAILFMMQ